MSTKLFGMAMLTWDLTLLGGLTSTGKEQAKEHDSKFKLKQQRENNAKSKLNPRTHLLPAATWKGKETIYE